MNNTVLSISSISNQCKLQLTIGPKEDCWGSHRKTVRNKESQKDDWIVEIRMYDYGKKTEMARTYLENGRLQN